MWQRFTLYDVRVIGHYLGVLVLFSSLALLVPFVTALACAEWTPATHYLLTIGIALIVGSALRFLRIDPGRLNRQQALAVTGFAWIVLAFVAAVPLYLSGHYLSYLDALFDGVSGLTTTGASVIVISLYLVSLYFKQVLRYSSVSLNKRIVRPYVRILWKSAMYALEFVSPPIKPK